MSPISMTLSDHEGHFTCLAVDQISTDIARRAVSLR